MARGDLSGLEGELSSEAAGATAFAAWTALGMLVQLVVTSPGQLVAARELLEADLLALDLACSRFRADSELVAVGNVARGASGPVSVSVSPLLAEAVAVSLRAAQLTDGDLDPTVGGVLAELGYDRDFADLTQPGQSEVAGNDTGGVTVRVIPGWRSVRVNVGTGGLPCLRGCGLTLGRRLRRGRRIGPPSGSRRRLAAGPWSAWAGTPRWRGNRPPGGGGFGCRTGRRCPATLRTGQARW